ncbi:GPP34 family phosphoprotein [Agromyces sp. LHK192]|uniref:GOLPH3/VPS74 family protein n=1 Tax=Agromyces sp. LHK192 TaxID=2498704 RepID=UPI000FD6CB14|nr:GPP34 family phosphoprotein [Agromyces sp. LHK192]
MTDQAGHDATTTRYGVADDLLLLLFQPASGTVSGENTLFYVLAGAVLTDLALEDAVAVDDRGARGTVVAAAGDTAPDDELLLPMWEYLADKSRGVQTALAAIGPRLREPVLDRLVARGDLRRERGRVLGFIPTETIELGDTGRREQLVAAVRATLVDGAEPTARTAALAALLSASGALPTLHREIPWGSAVATRAKELERGDFGADAAAQAVTRTMTAVVVNAVIAAGVVSGR